MTTLKNSDARPKSWIVWMKSDVVGKMLFHATDLSASDLDRSSIAAPLDDGWYPSIINLNSLMLLNNSILREMRPL